jgi:diaminopimelate decarboxylase
MSSGISVLVARRLQQLARRHGTPLYVYDLKLMGAKARALKSALPKGSLIQYAMKANSNDAVLRVFRREGLGVDVVSGGEMKLALGAGFRPSDLVFSGVGKTAEEIEAALRRGIRSVNVESAAELRRILDVSARLKRVARVSLRLNPNVNPRTHRHITTGRDFNKFGISRAEFGPAMELLRRHRDRLQLVGLAFHLGSQIQSLTPYGTALGKIKNTALELIADGFPLEHLSLGGGLAICYHGERALNLKTFGGFVRSAFKNLPVKPMCEPGRALVGEAGFLLTEVQYIKDTGKTKFAVVDTGMHHLMRPALYDAYHEILPLQPRAGHFYNYEIVGPICESTDVLGRARRLPELRSGDLLAILQAGAYGFVMANHYNSHALPDEVSL